MQWWAEIKLICLSIVLNQWFYFHDDCMCSGLFWVSVSSQERSGSAFVLCWKIVDCPLQDKFLSHVKEFKYLRVLFMSEGEIKK